MQAHRFRTDIWHKDGGRFRIVSTNWQTVSKSIQRLREVTELTVNIVTPTTQKSVTTARADERIALR